jgi:hypothetical protein
LFCDHYIEGESVFWLVHEGFHSSFKPRSLGHGGRGISWISSSKKAGFMHYMERQDDIFFLGGGTSDRPQIACWIHQEQRRSKNNHPE